MTVANQSVVSALTMSMFVFSVERMKLLITMMSLRSLLEVAHHSDVRSLEVCLKLLITMM